METKEKAMRGGREGEKESRGNGKGKKKGRRRNGGEREMTCRSALASSGSFESAHI